MIVFAGALDIRRNFDRQDLIKPVTPRACKKTVGAGAFQAVKS